MFWKRQNYDDKKISVIVKGLEVKELKGRDKQAEHREFFEQGNYSVLF